MPALELIITENPAVTIGARGVAGLLQCVRMIVLTQMASIPLDRDFAWEDRLVDSPVPRGTARQIGALIAAIERYEPRVKVDRVAFVQDAATPQSRKQDYMDGRLTPKITFHLRDGVDLED